MEPNNPEATSVGKLLSTIATRRSIASRFGSECRVFAIEGRSRAPMRCATIVSATADSPLRLNPENALVGKLERNWKERIRK
jgi:hypothetical protein